MSEGKYGIENLKEVIKVVIAIVKKLQLQFSDGVQTTDFIELVKWAAKDETFHSEMADAVKDIQLVFPEIMDMKFSEILELFSFIKDEAKELNIDFTKFWELVKHIPILDKILKKIFY